MPPALVLIHSPFLGPATWQPTARAIEQRGRRVIVPSLLDVAGSAPPHWPAGRDAVVRAVADEQVVLVPHSNAGLYVPTVLDALGDQVRGVVFVDAALPGAGHHTPREFLDGLDVEDGLLPPWTSWWADDDVAALFPDAGVRTEVEAEQPRMPLSYYDHLPPAPAGWAAPRSGYLWFGAPYDRGAVRAEALGWPTAHLPGNHLHMLTDPDAVADAVLRMADALVR
jgi:pimeloyl-ACP methyl ester carboxylesterase